MDQRSNLQPDIIKLLEQNIGDILQDIEIGKNFLEKTPEVQAITTINEITSG